MDTPDLAAKGQKKLQLFLAKSRGTSEVQSKHRDATPSITTSSASAVHQLDCCSRSTVVSAVDASTDPSPAPSKPLFAPSDAPAFEHSLTNPSNSSEVSGLPSSPIPRHYADTSIFNSPLTSPAASSAGDTTLLSAQVVDLRRRLAECERDKDARSREYDMIIQQALDAAAAVRLELQEVRDRSFEDSESLHFQHQQALGSLNSENLRLQQTIDSSQAMKEVIAERLHAIEAELVDTTSRLEAAQCKLSEQTALCLLAQARQEELQLVITTQMQEISTLGSRHSSSLIAFQQRECDLQDKIQADGIAHKEEVNGMRSQIATLSTELQHHKSALSSLHQEIEISRSTYNAKSNDDSNAASTEVAKLRLLMQESSENAAVLISKLQSDFKTKEQELVASQAAVTESNRRESSLQQQVELLLSQLSQKNQNAQEQKAVLSSPAFASPGDSTALEVSTRRVAEIERKYAALVAAAGTRETEFSSSVARLEKDLAAAHTMLMHQRSHAAQELHLTMQQSLGPTSCAACIKMSFKFVAVSAMRSFRNVQLMIGAKPKRLHDEHIV